MVDLIDELRALLERHCAHREALEHLRQALGVSDYVLDSSAIDAAATEIAHHRTVAEVRGPLFVRMADLVGLPPDEGGAEILEAAIDALSEMD